jgi:hypothetical protein
MSGERNYGNNAPTAIKQICRPVRDTGVRANLAVQGIHITLPMLMASRNYGRTDYLARNLGFTCGRTFLTLVTSLPADRSRHQLEP